MAVNVTSEDRSLAGRLATIQRANSSRRFAGHGVRRHDSRHRRPARCADERHSGLHKRWLRFY